MCPRPKHRLTETDERRIVYEHCRPSKGLFQIFSKGLIHPIVYERRLGHPFVIRRSNATDTDYQTFDRAVGLVSDGLNDLRDPLFIILRASRK